MNSIIYVGMDVHKNSHTLACYRIEDEKVKFKHEIPPDYKEILKYLEQTKKLYAKESKISPDSIQYVCGYEAGCLGYTLYHQLTEQGIKCEILAPTTMAIAGNKRVKNDKRDAGNIAKCLAFRTYSAVSVPKTEDNEVKEYIRMRDDHKGSLKVIKQQILAFVLRHGFRFDGGKNYWTVKHINWLKTIEMSVLLRECLDEYLNTFQWLTDKIERLDQRIEEFAARERYCENVKKLSCMLGVKTYTALSVIVETGDFHRFAKAEQYAAFLGLVPSEESSGDKCRRGGITKTGNSHVRKILVEAAQCYSRGAVGFKSKALKARQQGNSPQIIAYADKANERLRRKFYHMTLKNNINRNIAVTAIARELACFMWGLMTNHIE